MKIDSRTILYCRNAYRHAYRPDKDYIGKDFFHDKVFFNYVKITTKQLERYRQTGKLHGSPEAHAIVTGMRRLPIYSPYFKALFRVFEIKYGLKPPRRKGCEEIEDGS